MITYDWAYRTTYIIEVTSKKSTIFAVITPVVRSHYVPWACKWDAKNLLLILTYLCGILPGKPIVRNSLDPRP